MCMATIPDIVNRILPSVVKWNDEFRPRAGKKKTPGWKQILKNKFVHLQLTSDPRQHKQWREQLATAETLAIEQVCPNWQTKENESAISIRKMIREVINKKKSPRAGWLEEKAYAWLQSMSPEIQKYKRDPSYLIQFGTERFRPESAIQIAHNIFLGECSKFQTFMNYVEKRKRKDPAINELINAHKREGLCR